MKKIKETEKIQQMDSWERYISKLRLLLGKNLSDNEIWRYYITDPKNNNDPFGGNIADVINLFLREVDSIFESVNLEYHVSYYNTAIAFYLLLLKHKYNIQRGKQEKKQEDYFTFKPSANSRMNYSEYTGESENCFDGEPYILFEENKPAGFREILDNSFKLDTIIPAGTLVKIQSAEKKLSALFEKYVNKFAEDNVYSCAKDFKFPVQNELPLFLLKYTDNLYSKLHIKGKVTRLIEEQENNYIANHKKRLLIFYKVYNKKKFIKELNQIILKRYWQYITESLDVKPVIFYPDEDKEALTRFWPWKQDSIYNYISKPEFSKTDLTEEEYVYTLLHEGQYLHVDESLSLYIFLSRFLKIRIKEDVDNKILERINSYEYLKHFKIILKSYREKILENPGILLLLSLQINNMTPDDFDNIFYSKTDEEKKDIEEYFSLIDSFSISGKETHFTPGELLTKKYLKNDDSIETKQNILYSFLYFIIWGQLKKMIPLQDNGFLEDGMESEIQIQQTEEELLSSFKFPPVVAQKKILARQELINKMYEGALNGQCFNFEFLCEVLNTLISYYWTTEAKVKIEISAFNKIDFKTLSHMVYNFSKDEAGLKYGFYREMTFISDKKKKKLPVKIDTERWFKSPSEANNYIEQIELNRKTLKEIDVGLSFGRRMSPIPDARFFWERGICLKLFPDSDKEYKPADIKITKGRRFTRHYITGGEEKYRITNKNHLLNFYMYEAMRNPETHDEGEVLVLTSLKNDSKVARVETLLESLYDCYENCNAYVNYLKEHNQSGEMEIPTLFYKNKLDEVINMLAEKMEDLPQEQKDFSQWFDSKGNIKLDSSIYKDISYSDDELFLSKLKNVFVKFYGLDFSEDLMKTNKYEFDFSIIIMIYLLYINVRLADL